MIVVGFPWRPTPDRLAAFEVVSRWYADTLPDAAHVTADSGHDPFSRACSRNDVVTRAQEMGAEVVVLSDADTVPSPAGLHLAIDAARNGGLHYPFDHYLYAGTNNPAGGNTGGIYVCRPDVWWSFGGMDPRFDGWGGEDDQAHAAAECLIGTPVNHPGWAVSFPHAGDCRDVGSQRWKPNSDLAIRYHLARHSPTKMRAIIAERADA